MKIISTKLSASVVTALMTLSPVLGARDLTWCRPMNQKQTVSTLDQPISLVWAGNHAVHRFLTKDAFDNCDFSQAETVCPTSQGGSCELPGLVDGETFYYGCPVTNHCTDGGQKLALTVSKPAANERRLFGLCDK